MKRIFILFFFLILLSSCERLYTHQFKLQNNSTDTLWINYIEQSSTFKSQFPDTVRSFMLLPTQLERSIYTVTGENAATAPDIYENRIDIFENLEIATIKSYYPDTTGTQYFDTSFVEKDFLSRNYWEYFIDKNQDAGVYLFKIENSDLE